MSYSRLFQASALVISLTLSNACIDKEPASRQRSAEAPDSESTPSISVEQLPDPDLSQMDPRVGRQLSDARRILLERFATGLIRAPSGTETSDTETFGKEVGALGMLYHAYDLLSAAEQTYSLAQTLEPDAFRWAYYSGMVAQRQGRHEDAALLLTSSAQILEQQRSLDADAATAVAWRMGQVLRQTNRNHEAKTWLDRAGRNATRCPAALFELGQLALNDERPEQAVEYFEQALKIQDDATQIYFPLGQALRQAGRDREAQTYLRRSTQREKSIGGRALCIDPLDTELGELTTGVAAFITRGQHARFAGDLDGAIEDFQRAVEIDGHDPVAHQALAKGLAEKGDLEGAIQHFQQAVALDPESPTLAHDLALLWIRAGRLSEAGLLLTKTQIRHPDFVPSWLTFARVQLSQGVPQDALISLDRALSLEPDNSRARGQRAQVLVALGRRDEAVKELALLLSQYPPSDPAERLRLAGALAQLGDSEQAHRHLNALLDEDSVTDPLKARAHLSIAGLALQKKDSREARRHLQLALALDPDLQPAKVALEQLGSGE